MGCKYLFITNPWVLQLHNVISKEKYTPTHDCINVIFSLHSFLSRLFGQPWQVAGSWYSSWSWSWKLVGDTAHYLQYPAIRGPHVCFDRLQLIDRVANYSC